jgi:preprotein translocase subunit SecA
MTIEYRFEEPPPPPNPFGGMLEVHMDPLTGVNERQRGLVPEGVPEDQRQFLPASALPGDWERTSRNAPCPCGSGKKFKHCHGALV